MWKNISQINLTSTQLKHHALLIILGTVMSSFRCDLANATNYYVSGNGDDSNNGLSTSTAFRNIQKAADLTNPGDTVFVMNGLYINSWPTGDVVTVTHSGSPSAWIKYKAYPGNSPKLKFNGWSGFNIISGASYIEINGFEIEGNNDNITLNYALSQENNLDNPLTSGNGITAGSDKAVHHIRVLFNKVYKCGGGGIAFRHADYINIEHNAVYENSWYSPYGNSGISLYQNWNFDNKTGYKMYVRNNISYSNTNYVPSNYAGMIIDGTGIIIDDSRNTQNGSTLGAYSGRTLVANNVVFNNGVAGIHVFSSDHVDVVNNTAYMNSQTPTANNGEIDANSSGDVNVINNILYSIPGKTVNSNWKNSPKIIYDYNIYFNSTNIAVLGPHDLQADPRFVNPSTDSASADFHLQSTSPAINSGTAHLAPHIDMNGNSRPSCGAYDRGGYESTNCVN